MKKFLNVLVLVAIALSLIVAFTGCDSNTGTTGEAGGELNFKAIIPARGDLRAEGTEVHAEWLKKGEEYIGKKINVEIQSLPGNDLGEKSKVMLASGDLPELMIVEDNTQIISYGKQEILANLNEYKDSFKYYQEYIDNTPGGKRAVETPEGGLYAFYYGQTNGMVTSQAHFQYRYDIFEKNNIKVPETLDEFYDAAKKLKEIYPDSWPLSSEKSATWYNIVSPLAMVNRTSHDMYWNGEEYKFGPLEDAYKDTLMFLNKMYEEELLDPEFMVATQDQLNKKCLDGTTFMLVNSWGKRVATRNNNKEVDVKWCIAMPPANEKYGQPWGSQIGGSDKPSLSTWGGLVMSAKAENKEDLVKLLDYQYSDEMVELLNWGIKDKTFTVDENGEKHFVDSIMTAEDPAKAIGEVGLLTGMTLNPGFNITPQDLSAQYSMLPPDPFYYKGVLNEEDNFFVAYSKCDAADYKAPEAPPTIVLTDEQRDFESNTLSAIRAYVEEMQIKFITGKESFDNWDKYIEQIYSLGDIQAVIDMHNEVAWKELALTE